MQMSTAPRRIETPFSGEGVESERAIERVWIVASNGSGLKGGRDD